MNRKDIIEAGLLALRAQGGDARAFEALVCQWSPRIQAHVQRLLGSAEAARDVTQDVWAAVVERMDALTDPEAFPAWVFRIATNKARDWQRNRVRHRTLLAAFAWQRAGARAGSGVRAGSADDLPLHVLAPPQREAILLFYFEEFSLAEVSAITGASLGTVKSRLHTARARLRQAIEEAGYGREG